MEYHLDFVAAEFSNIHIRKRANGRQIFLQVLQNAQNLTFRSNNGNGNFHQPLKRCKELDPRIIESSNKNRCIIKYMKGLQAVNRDFFSEMFILLKILMIAPATNAVSESSASTLKLLKNWLLTTMSHERFNFLMLLLIHKNKTDELKLIDIANQFCQGNRDSEFTLGKFTTNDFSKLLPCKNLTI